MSIEAGAVAGLTGVAIGGRALILSGPPGSGKSSLALALIDRGAMLIGDDGLTLDLRDGAVWAAPPPEIDGLLEIRNVGLIAMQVTEAPVALMLQLTSDAARFVDAASHFALCGRLVPHLQFRAGDAVQALRAEHALIRYGLTIGHRD